MATSTYPTITAGITQTTQANWIPELWADEMLVTREANLVAAKLFRRLNHKGKPGDIIHVPNVSDFAAAAKASVTGVIIQNITEGEKQIALDQHRHVAFMIEDIAALQSNYAIRRVYTEKAGYAMAKDIDTAILNNYSSLAAAYQVIGGDGTTQYSSVGAGNGSALSDAGFRRMIRTLRDNDVPEKDLFMIVPPVVWETLMGIDKFVLADHVGRTGPITQGLIGQLYGVPVYISTNCPTVTAADATTTYRVCMLAHKDAIWCAMQQSVRTQVQYKLEYLSNLVVVDSVYGTKVMRGEADDTTNNRKSHAVAFYVPS